MSINSNCYYYELVNFFNICLSERQFVILCVVAFIVAVWLIIIFFIKPKNLENKFIDERLRRITDEINKLPTKKEKAETVKNFYTEMEVGNTGKKLKKFKFQMNGKDGWKEDIITEAELDQRLAELNLSEDENEMYYEALLSGIPLDLGDGITLQIRLVEQEEIEK